MEGVWQIHGHINVYKYFLSRQRRAQHSEGNTAIRVQTLNRLNTKIFTDLTVYVHMKKNECIKPVRIRHQQLNQTRRYMIKMFIKMTAACSPGAGNTWLNILTHTERVSGSDDHRYNTTASISAAPCVRCESVTRTLMALFSSAWITFTLIPLFQGNYSSIIPRVWSGFICHTHRLTCFQRLYLKTEPAVVK